MKKIKFLSLTLLLVFGLTACGGGSSEVNQSEIIRVGSKDFTESLIVSEIYALALEDHGYKVERVQNIAGSVVHTSLINDEIDLYPEYTGTGLLVILKEKMESDPDVVFEKVKTAYAEQFNLVWLDYAQANNSQGLVMRKDKADELGIRTISDLQSKADQIRFASQGEFDMRDDGLVGLEKIYGPFNFASSQVYANDLKYQILLKDEADLTPAYTTEGQLIDTDKFLLIEDDLGFWPPYNLAPVVQKSVIDAHPDIVDILNFINTKLDSETMIHLNAQADLDGLSYEEVAKMYYEGLNL